MNNYPTVIHSAPAGLPPTHPLRPGLPPLPGRFRHLPVDRRGWPVPWFVQWTNDGQAATPTTPGAEPDFRVMDAEKRIRAVKYNLCWLCGDVLGRFKTFVVGPMCGINRVSSEPPCHYDCADFAARACPFLTMPKMVRNDHNKPDGYVELPGMIPRNPGVALLWATKDFKILPVENDYLLIMGAPESVTWYAEGRIATREEIMTSIATGCPALLEKAMAGLSPDDQQRAAAQLAQEVNAFVNDFVPAA